MHKYVPLWILGAPDPEMAAIEALLQQHGQDYVYAALEGCRVSPGTVYRANSLLAGSGSPLLHLRSRVVYLVECSHVCLDGPERDTDVRRIDHHRPGDPGYGKPPHEFWLASSIGQAMAALGQTNIAPEHLLIAAADHCLHAAYRGECPGVDPDVLMRWRAESRAVFQRRQVAAVLADVEKAQAALRAAPRIPLIPASTGPCAGLCDGYCPDQPHTHPDAACFVADLRGQLVPELPEAAARLGMAFIADVLPYREVRTKIVLQCASPDHVAAWPQWAAKHGIVDLYGDPQRGFAGGYLS